MSQAFDSIRIKLVPEDNAALQNLCGWHEEHLAQIEARLGVEINHLSFDFVIKGPAIQLMATEQVIRDLYHQSFSGLMSAEAVHLYLTELAEKTPIADVVALTSKSNEQLTMTGYAVLRPHKKLIRARTANQDAYIRTMHANDITFGIGPAGTGKTYMAVARAVELLENEQVRRLILTRPAVEAGEKLGFLPGDLAQKVDPYLRPLYDALYELLGFDQVTRLMERNVIEVAPLAFMRGRTLNESCILLDEAQNTTLEQMKMFLTRVGFGSKVIVTGDMSQIDLPNKYSSGLRQAADILKDIDGIGFTFFTAKDVVRHPLVQRVVEAYERFEKTKANTAVTTS
jgi:phosphate starvation-inducible PhoH-like protein